MAEQKEIHPKANDVSGPASRRLHGSSLLLDDPVYEEHVPLAYHPERPERLRAARAALERPGVRWTHVQPRDATDEELLRVHEPEYLKSLTELRGQRAYLDPDTYVSERSVGAARKAAGGLVSMVDALIDGDCPRGVALLRPPGHHARASQAMGFCLLNNVAVAAAHARARGLSRVAIVDWDVHHGNGTQEIFYRDPSVLYLSTHQYPFYPGTGAADERGEGEGQGYTVNVPLLAGGGDGVYRAAFERVILPVLESFKPELVLVSAGFDAAKRDPLAEMELTSRAFGWMAHALAAQANASAKGRIALVLEGGYDLVAVEAGLAAAIDGVVRGDKVDIPRAPDAIDIARAAETLREDWPTVD
ncbi:histone deacetylase [Pendulispora rubella]|uniref:histone deacetylase n=1 Tax=Pendulispora rubella TaxID=2741070 RepID=A0ABZ2L0Z0_9BACT